MDSIAFTMIAFGEFVEETDRPALPPVITVGADAPSCAPAETSSETRAASESHRRGERADLVFPSMTKKSWPGLRG
jgi:hypothetical protein